MKFNSQAYELTATKKDGTEQKLYMNGKETKSFIKNNLEPLIDKISLIQYISIRYPEWVESLNTDTVAKNPINYRDSSNPKRIWFQESVDSEPFQLTQRITDMIKAYCEDHDLDIKMMLFRFHDLVHQNNVKNDAGEHIWMILKYIEAYYAVRKLIKKRQIRFRKYYIEFTFEDNDLTFTLKIPNRTAMFNPMYIYDYFTKDYSLKHNYIANSQNLVMFHMQLEQLYKLLQ